METKPLLQNVLAEIKPKDKSTEKQTAAMLQHINKQLQKDKLKAKAVAGGSIAKGTYLAYDHDCDIFVQFDKSYADKDISSILQQSLKKIFPNLLSLHGSRDYFQIRNGLHFEIVPVLAIKKSQDAVNITDCSPLHVTWVKKFPKCADEIRLTRAFCKANEVYGAESYIKGFSGHVIDIITIHYGSFMKLLKAAAMWKHKTVIDTNNAHKGKALRELNQSKLTSPLIVIDPVEASRNAAASLSEEKFQLFIKKAKEFLKHPSKEYFIRQEFSLKSLEQEAKGKRLIIIESVPMEGKEDVSGAKLLKAFEFIREETKRYGFQLQKAGWHWDKQNMATYYYIFDKEPIPGTFVQQGPPVEIKQHADAFKKAHPDAFVKGGKLCATRKRDHVLPENFIKTLLVHPYLKDKAKKITLNKSEK